MGIAHRRTAHLALALAAALSLTTGLAGCQGQAPGQGPGAPAEGGKADGLGTPADGPKGRYVGQTEFVSAAPFYRVFAPFLRAAADTRTVEAASPERTVEESDVFRLEGDHLYVLNTWRGLQVLDVSNPDRPQMTGRVEIWGRPVEMYVRGDRAFLLVSDYFRHDGEKSFRGSRVVTVDLSDKARPRVIGSLEVPGNITDSRLVGDVIYVVAIEYAWYSWLPGASVTDQTHVVSVDITGARPTEVEKVAFDGTSYQIHATPSHLFLAEYQYPSTSVQVLDISDPKGHIVVGGQAVVPGTLQDRFQMSFRDGYLRVISHHWEGNGTVFVRSLAVGPGGAISEAGKLELPGVGSLLATRFDGEKAYLVHIVRVDPLDVIDFSDPTNPVRLSSLEIPGWLEHLEIRGGRVLGIGIDNTSGQNQIAVAMYDVSDPRNTQELSRTAIADTGWAWSGGFYDDRAFRVLDDAGLVLVPFSAWSQDGSLQAVQLVDFDLESGQVRARGRVEQAGDVRRAFPLGDTRHIAAFSDRELRVADVADRDRPGLTARLELARNVQSFIKLPTAGIQLVGDWDSEPELRSVPLGSADADETDIYARVKLPRGAERLFAAGSMAVVLSRDYAEGKQTLTLTAVDFARPRQPVTRGSFSFDVDGYGNGVRPLASLALRAPWYYSAETEVKQVRPELFAVANISGEGRTFRIVSFANPDAPRVVHERALEAQGQYIDMRLVRTALYVTHFEVTETGAPLDAEVAVATRPGENPGGDEAVRVSPSLIYPQPTQELGKYFVTKIQVGPSGRLEVSAPVNIPGRFVDTDARGNLLTLDQRWADEGGEALQHKHLTKLTVNFRRGQARLRDLLNVPDGVYDVIVREGAAYYTTFEDSWRGPIIPLAETVPAGLPGGGGEGGLEGEPVVAPAPEPPKWELHIVDITRDRLVEGAHSVITRDGSGSLVDVRQVGERRFAFLTLGWGGLAVWDVTDSAAPRQVKFVPANGWYSEVLVDAPRHLAHVWSGYYGVRTFRLPR